MLRKIFLSILITAICLLNVAPVLASNTAVVTILGIPIYSGGIITFNVIYVSDTEMDLNWTVGAGVENVMVRAKYGTPPANPINDITAPSDGYLVYYGSGLSAIDTSMDMNQNGGTLYYEAWAQKLDGTWNLVSSSKSEESREVVLIFLGMLGTIGSIFAIYKRNILFAIGASVVWFFLIAYTRSNPLPNIATGSSTDSLFIGVCVSFSLATMLSVFILNNQEKNKENPPPDEHIVNRHNTRSSSYESADDYQARLASLKKKR